MTLTADETRIFNEYKNSRDFDGLTFFYAVQNSRGKPANWLVRRLALDMKKNYIRDLNIRMGYSRNERDVLHYESRLVSFDIVGDCDLVSNYPSPEELYFYRQELIEVIGKRINGNPRLTEKFFLVMCKKSYRGRQFSKEDIDALRPWLDAEIFGKYLPNYDRM